MELNKENVKKIMKIIAFALVLYFILQNIGVFAAAVASILGILSPFLFGAGFAFVLNIPMRYFEKKLFKPKKLKNGKVKQSKLKRAVSILLAFVIIVLIISFVIKLVIPQLIDVISMLLREIVILVYELKDWALEMTEQYPDISNQIRGIEIHWDAILNEGIGRVSNVAGNVVTSSIGFVISVVGGIFDAIVSLIFAVYILMSKEKLAEQGKKIMFAYLPEEKAEYMLEIAALSNHTFCNFITGQCTEAVILGVLCFLGMLILKLPFAATISVVVGVTALIPIVGCFIGFIVGAILILAISPIQAVVFVVFLLILQQVETNIIYPKVVGSSVGLPGMWVLVAVVLGGSLGGMLGLLLGLPTISVLYTILKNDVNRKLEKKKNP